MSNNELGFKVIYNFFNEDDVSDISKQALELRDNNLTKKDSQCPLSDGFYSNNDAIPFLLQIHEKLTPVMKKEFGKDLAKTYCYGRIYYKGEELIKHTDRESCEYSVTATFTSSDDKNPWDFFIKGEDNREYKIGMFPGDMTLYKGNCEHWREICEKDWQIQIFFHFVDLNGEYKDHANDALIDKCTKERCETCLVHYWTYSADGEKIPEEVCDIYKVSNTDDFQFAEIGMNDTNGIVDNNIRNVKKKDIQPFTGIPAYLTGAMLDANNQIWQFNITNCSQSEYLIYKEGYKYNSHTDVSWTTKYNQYENIRKLTAITLLNDDFTGGKFYIETEMGRIYPEQTKGTIIVFPSFCIHGVEPVISGERHCVVSWFNGERFK
jgi:hypothetical protein